MTDGPSDEWSTLGRRWMAMAKAGDLRGIPIPLGEKRRLRELRPVSNAESWMAWTQRLTCACARLSWPRCLLILSALKLWEKTLIDIRGRFGSSICTYFSFLRFLMLLNFTSVLLTTGLVTIPVFLTAGDANHSQDPLATQCTNSSSPPPYRSTFSPLLDLFTGEGMVEDSFLFYGHYSMAATRDSTYNTHLAYLLTPLAFLIFCFLGLLRCTVTGITQRRMRRRNYRTPIRSRLFSSWDFCIQGEGNSSLKQQSLSNYFKSYLAEERHFWEESQRPVTQRARRLLRRVLINVFIMLLIVGGLYSIHLATGFSQQHPGSPSTQQSFRETLLGLAIQFLAPFVIWLVLLILPYCFKLLGKLEGRSPSTTFTLTLIRCIFLRLGTLGIFFFSLVQDILCLWSDSTPCEACGYNTDFQCWETSVGQEIYKVCIFNFLFKLMDFFIFQLPRRYMVPRWKCGLAHWLGRQRFQLSQNVLDEVYSQTLVMGGLFYAPLLPILHLAFLFITFYLDRFSLYWLCDSSRKHYRESTVRMTFYFVLLLGLLTILLPLIYVITSVRPSYSCGPFIDFQTPLEAVQRRARSVLPPAVLTMWSSVTSQTGAYTLFFILWLVLTAFVSRVRQKEQDVEHLKNLLSNQKIDKKYLSERLQTEQSQLMDHQPPESHQLTGHQETDQPPEIYQMSGHHGTDQSQERHQLTGHQETYQPPEIYQMSSHHGTDQTPESHYLTGRQGTNQTEED